MWEGYNFWCGCVRCTATGKIIGALVVDGEADKLDDLSKRVSCTTDRCRGYNVPDDSRGGDRGVGIANVPLQRLQQKRRI